MFFNVKIEKVVGALTKHNDMGHVWPKYGNGMT